MDTQELQRIKNKYDIIGNDAALNTAIETAIKVAPVDITVLVMGESGVGKEIIPKIIHQNSKRKNNKYFAVNCGAIPEGTIDSELFGHEKGSFTGAIESRKGYFQEANGGTLFLDEIGELPLASQAKLLRVLQSGEYIKVGSSKVEKTDVRVIAATNVNLEYAVAQGKFREDLYYRLNAVQVLLPPLRDRKEDIYLLFRKFTSDFSEKNGRKKINLTTDAIKLLTSYRWPGNVRQLKNVAEAIAALESEELNHLPSQRQEIDANTLLKYMPKDMSTSLPVKLNNNEGSSINEAEKMKIFELLHSLTNEVNRLKMIVEGNSSQFTGDKVLPINTLISSNQDHTSEQWKNTVIQMPNQHSEINHDVDIQENTNNDNEDFSIKKNYIDLINKALEKNGGNRRKAAQELGISERTLYRKLSNNQKSE